MFNWELKWKPEYDALALYNAEIKRGLVHTADYMNKMKRVQEAYNEELLKEYESCKKGQ